MELIENKTAKNKGGRPELKTKKDTSINVRMTRLERILIEQKAKQAKLSATAWFRKAAKRAKIHSRITEEDMKILRVLAGMANNLNQLTKLAHTYGFLKFQKDCQELISKINMVFKEFKGKQE